VNKKVFHIHTQNLGIMEKKLTIHILT
jgi:hypothetical protein